MHAKRAKKQPLIEYLIENYYDTEEQVLKAVKLGVISINNKPVKRAGVDITEEDKVKVIGDSKLFVSRGGYKLQKGLEFFGLDITDQTCLDVGASTGGFTDCMLQYHADKVYSVDTGYGQLDWGLRKDSRVKLLERTNIRYLLPERMYSAEEIEKNQKATFIAVDVSFISVLTLLSSIQALSAGQNRTNLIVLIKPQFEAKKDSVARGGVIQNPSLHYEIVDEFVQGCFKAGLDLKGLTYSPLLGASGNLELLAHLTWPQGGRSLNPNLESLIKKTIELAYEEFGL